jgi:hypothetical protein
VIDVTKYGLFKVLGKGQLPAQPLVVKAKFFSKLVGLVGEKHSLRWGFGAGADTPLRVGLGRCGQQTRVPGARERGCSCARRVFAAGGRMGVRGCGSEPRRGPSGASMGVPAETWCVSRGGWPCLRGPARGS